MADLKYGKFCIESYCKILIFLLLCVGARIGFGFAPFPVDILGGSVFAIMITWFFLTYVEGGKRSFFAKGYMLENVVPGAVWGIAVFALAGIIMLVMGQAKFIGLRECFELNDIFFPVIKTSLFAAIVIFGYVFHIVLHDFGSITAIILSSLLYTAAEIFLFGTISPASVFASDVVSLSVVLSVANTVLTAVSAGLLIICHGDMRSAAAFLCFNKFIILLAAGERDIVPWLNIKSFDDVTGSIWYTLVLLIAAVSIFITYKRSE